MAVLVRAETDPLYRRGAITDPGEHLLAGERELYGNALDHLRGQRGEDGVGVGQPLRAEAATDERRNDPHSLPVETEDPGYRLPDGVYALGRVVQREVATLPDSDGGVRLHRVVVLGRGRVRLVQRDRRRGERAVEITLLGVGGEGRIDYLRGVQVVAIPPQLCVLRLFVVGDPDETCRVPRHLEGFGDDGRDVLPAIGDFIGLQDGKLPIAGVGQLRGSLVRDDGDDAGEGLGLTHVYLRDAALCDRRPNR